MRRKIMNAENETEGQPQVGSDAGLGIEFYLARLYRHSEGWHFTFGEVLNHDSGASFAIFTFGWNQDDGTIFTLFPN